MKPMHGRDIVQKRRAVGLGLAASLVWLALATAGPAAAVSLPSLFDTAPAPGGPSAGARHGVQRRATVRQRQATVRRGLLTHPDGSAAVGAGDRLRLNLFDDASFSLTVADVTRHPGRGHTWSGTLDGVDLGYAVLADYDGALVGHVIMPGAVYRIGYAPDGSQVVEEIDQSALPPEGHGMDPVPAVAEDLQAGGEVPDVAADAAIPIDVMVLYTAAARAAAGGTAAMQAEVNLAVAATNQAYQNNNLSQRLRLVFAGEVSITEGDFNADLDSLQVNPKVDWLRNVSRADLVSLITDHGPNSAFCGVAYRMRTNSAGFAPFGFSVVERACASSNLTFAHELGHNMGAHHDPYVTGVPDNALFPYSHGYVDLVGRFRTIMAYPDLCLDAGLVCNKIPFFSTPGTTQNGRPIGTAVTADNARTLSQTAATIASFRQAATAPLTITTGVNKPAFAVGETLVASVGVSNPGIAVTADVYLGLLRPDGSTTFVTDVVGTGASGFVNGNILDFATYRPIAAGVSLGAPGAANFPSFLSLQRTSSDQAGGFVWFLLAVTSGALRDGILAPNELLGASFSPFSYPK